jgi:TRAP-type C4-dicarboxylate transport system substrate-binding protein
MVRRLSSPGIVFSLCAALLALAFCQVRVADAADLPKITLKVSQAMMPKTSFTHQMIEEMAANVTKRSDGNITWRIFGPEVGDWAELERMTKRGAMDMQFNSFDTSLDPRMSLPNMPYTVSTWDEARKVYATGGVIEKIVGPWAEEKGLKYLGPWLNNLTSLGMRSQVVTNPEKAKGLKIRVPPIDAYRCFVEKMGFSTVTIPWAEAPTAVATGLVDGWVGSGAIYMYDLFRDVAKVMIVTLNAPEAWHVTFNLKTWNDLPETYKKIIQEEVNKVIAKQLENVEAEEMEYQAKLKDYGWTIVNMAEEHPEDLARWRTLAMECWDDLAPVVGKDTLEKFKADVTK